MMHATARKLHVVSDYARKLHVVSDDVRNYTQSARSVWCTQLHAKST